MKDTALVWFRRDFRLGDNPALAMAIKRHARIVPIYIHDPKAEGEWPPGAASRWWLHHALIDLDRSLRDKGARLVLRSGDTRQELKRLLRDTDAAAVYWNRLYEPALVARDRDIKAGLKKKGIDAQSFRAAVLFEPWELAKSDGDPYRVFTPFWNCMQRAWRAPEVSNAPRDFSAVDKSLNSDAIDSLGLLPAHRWSESLAETWAIGEQAGKDQLKRFDQHANQYDMMRDRPDKAGTSGLSPYLHFGHLSPARAATAMSASGELPTGKNKLSFVRELAWREFSIALLYHFPSLTDEPMQAKFKGFPWRKRKDYVDDLERWQQGKTGVPLVDAGMRQLWATGWMHNRVRMVTASWLTKNLLIPWHEGARWFWDTLVDADLANNTQGWQWTAGCGADAAPFFRVFNPERQAKKFDPEGDYVRRWCEELSDLSEKQLARLSDEQRGELGYPALQADLKQSRLRALDAFKQIGN